MGVKDSFMGSSIVAKIAFLILLVANLFSWISFTTTGWAESDSSNGHYGVWRTCGEGLSTCGNLDGTGEDWVGAFQAFAIFGFVAVNACFALIICFIFMDKCKGDKEASIAAAICGIAGAVCWLIAVIIFADKYEDDGPNDVDLDYGFGLAIVALILSAAGGVAMIFAQGGGGATKPSG